MAKSKFDFSGKASPRVGHRRNRHSKNKVKLQTPSSFFPLPLYTPPPNPKTKKEKSAAFNQALWNAVVTFAMSLPLSMWGEGTAKMTKEEVRKQKAKGTKLKAGHRG